MKTELTIQDVTDTNPTYLLDAIATAASGSDRGIALFAFATAAGIDLFFSLDNIVRLLTRGQLRLIVGIDAITDRTALLRLREMAERYAGLTTEVFWNRGDGIFHPKFCYFSAPAAAVCLVGSGNLTARGLRDSFEAWMGIGGTPNDLRHMSRRIEAFLEAHANDITAIDDAALRRASKNRPSDPVSKVEPTLLMSTLVAAQRGRKSSHRGRTRLRGQAVLVAELPRGGARWNQANFDFSTARGFFGVDPEHIQNQRDLFLTEVQAGDLSEKEEIRRFTFTKSRNLRVQLAAKSGLAYPETGRPIVVVRELKPRHFAYHLLFPGENGYQACVSLLAKNPSGNIRRAVVGLSAFRSAWPQSLLSQLD